MWKAPVNEPGPEMYNGAMIRSLLALILLAVPAGAVDWQVQYSSALARASAAHRRILVDFQAPWCYSCYYMEEKVLSGEKFARASQELVLLKLDVDKPEGKALKEKLGVSFLPSYVLLDSAGAPLGRIVGEQTEADFLAKLQALAGPPASAPADAALGALRSRLAAGEYPGQAEIDSLSPVLLEEARKKLAWRILEARLGLMRAAKENRPGGPDALAKLLKLEKSCDLAYDIVYSEKIPESFDDKKRLKLLKKERKALERLVKERFFGVEKDRCADFRTGIEVLVEVYDRLGLKEERGALLRRAISQLEGSAAKVGADRNRDDNLRFFLEMAGEDGPLRKLYPKLTEAYSTDYVYPYRFGRYLLERGEPSAALPWLDKAERMAYGANRVAVAKIKAKTLSALGKGDEALSLLDREIKAAGFSFPKEAEGLGSLRGELSGATPGK